MFEKIACTEHGWSAGLTGAGAVAGHERFAAVATALPLMSWPGRAHYDGHRVRHRIIVFDRATRSRRAVLDAARWPIHELAFRGDGLALAIACGAYDGGYFFEGELLVWDWTTGALRRPLRACREVVRARWIDDARVAVLVRPQDDGGGDESFSLVHGAALADADEPTAGGYAADPRVSEEPTDPAAFGFDGARAPEAREWARDGGLGPDQAHPPVRDVAYVGQRVASVDDGCMVCLWDASLGEGRRVTGEGHGVQLLRVGASVYVATLADRSSALFAIDGDELRPVRRFDRAYLFSTDAHGRLLARDTEPGTARRDLVLDADGATLQAADLGHFDVFNHSLRLDGEHLSYLRGTPASQHQRKVLMTIAPDGQHHQAMVWDGERSHRMEPSACEVDGGAIVTGYSVHDPRPGNGVRHVARRARDGATEWLVERPYAPVALAHAPAIDAVLVATLDGSLAALDARTGALRAEEQLTIDDVLAPPTCVAVEGERATVGTLDGRLVTVSLASGPQGRRRG